jgi:hypothetical protein
LLISVKYSRISRRAFFSGFLGAPAVIRATLEQIHLREILLLNENDLKTKNKPNPENFKLRIYTLKLSEGLTNLVSRDAPDNPAFFDIRYLAGYQITLPDIRPDIR